MKKGRIAVTFNERLKVQFLSGGGLVLYLCVKYYAHTTHKQRHVISIFIYRKAEGNKRDFDQIISAFFSHGTRQLFAIPLASNEIIICYRAWVNASSTYKTKHAHLMW